MSALVPASGLVTALEPVLRACDGTWVAHGSGDADRTVRRAPIGARAAGRSPLHAAPRLADARRKKRATTTASPTKGSGRSATSRTRGRCSGRSDWEQYQRRQPEVRRRPSSRRSTDSGAARSCSCRTITSRCCRGCIKERRPDARVAIFWHIPWPNPEAFGICPWQHELLDGLLGADLVGFHTQAHCNNFLETVDRALECADRVGAVHRRPPRQHVTLVQPFPISVATPTPHGARQAARATPPRAGPAAAQLGVDGAVPRRRRRSRRLHQGHPRALPRRSSASSRRAPEYREQFTFVQIGAPSRTSIKRYQELDARGRGRGRARSTALRSTRPWKPIVLLDAPPRPRGDRAALPARRLLPGHARCTTA